MIHVVIYQSKSDTLQQMSKYTAGYFQKIRHTYRIHAFAKLEDAEKHLREAGRNTDIFFADCSEPKRTLPVLIAFRESNTRASWVCTDTSTDVLFKLMLLRPSAYLEHSNDTQHLLTTVRKLDTYHQQIQKKEDFTFKYEGEYVRIPFHEISYFESNAKKVTLHLADRDATYHFTAKLDDIEARLPDTFLRCHQSYLINMQKIRQFDSKDRVFLLTSTEEILISRRNFTAVKDAYLAFSAAQREEPILP